MDRNNTPVKSGKTGNKTPKKGTPQNGGEEGRAVRVKRRAKRGAVRSLEGCRPARNACCALLYVMDSSLDRACVSAPLASLNELGQCCCSKVSFFLHKCMYAQLRPCQY
eukprot:1157529-Pelagomonas_calceolata.AAC.4